MRVTIALLTVLCCSAASQAQAADMPAGFVALSRAPARIERAGERLPAEIGAAVRVGDVLVTGEKGRLKVLLSDDSVIALGSRSRLEISAHLFEPSKRRSTRLTLLDGKVRALVHRAVAGDKADFELRSGTAIAGVRGTEFALLQEARGARVVTFSGSVSWRVEGGQPLIVAAGQASRAEGAGAPGRPEALAAAELTEIRSQTDSAQAPTALAWNLRPDRPASSRRGGPASVQADDDPMRGSSAFDATAPPAPSLGPGGAGDQRLNDQYFGSNGEGADSGRWQQPIDVVAGSPAVRLKIRLVR
ncbi:MAG: FecR domain-containing protein [Deltaproteobacteria bacterium]|nr:FecR domain-containing protein [Deltaproteobacteria bacterium]